MKAAILKSATSQTAARFAVFILAAAALSLTILSPVALNLVAEVRGMNWARLSNVGQTYGAISALLTALALGGVVISLIYQARDVRTTREQSARAFHYDLLKMEMADPLYMEALGAPWNIGKQINDFESMRQYNFVHMWVSYWESLYVQRQMSEPVLRSLMAEELFRGTPGRIYWASTGEARRALSEGRQIRFAKIMSEEYEKAVASGPPTTVSFRSAPDMATSRISGKKFITRPEILVCVGAAAGIIIRDIANNLSPQARRGVRN